MTSTEPRLWHVTVTVAGEPHDPPVVCDAMARLGAEHAFLHSMRYAADRAEIRYWEEAAEMLDAAALAMRVWIEHRESAGLPHWEVVGLEVLERHTYHARHPRVSDGAFGLASSAPQPF